MFESAINPMLLWMHKLWIVWIIGAIFSGVALVVLLYLAEKFKDTDKKKSGRYMVLFLVSGLMGGIFIILFCAAESACLLV